MHLIPLLLLTACDDTDCGPPAPEHALASAFMLTPWDTWRDAPMAPPDEVGTVVKGERTAQSGGRRSGCGQERVTDG